MERFSSSRRPFLRRGLWSSAALLPALAGMLTPVWAERCRDILDSRQLRYEVQGDYQYQVYLSINGAEWERCVRRRDEVRCGSLRVDDGGGSIIDARSVSWDPGWKKQGVTTFACTIDQAGLYQQAEDEYFVGAIPQAGLSLRKRARTLRAFRVIPFSF